MIDLNLFLSYFSMCNYVCLLTASVRIQNILIVVKTATCALVRTKRAIKVISLNITCTEIFVKLSLLAVYLVGTLISKSENLCLFSSTFYILNLNPYNIIMIIFTSAC